MRILASIFGFFALKNMIFYICLLLDKKWVNNSELQKMHIFLQKIRAYDFLSNILSTDIKPLAYTLLSFLEFGFLPTNYV